MKKPPLQTYEVTVKLRVQAPDAETANDMVAGILGIGLNNKVPWRFDADIMEAVKAP